MKRRRRIVRRSWRRWKRRVGRGAVRHRVALLMMLYWSHHCTKIMSVVSKATRAAEITDATGNPRGSSHLILGPEPEPIRLRGQIW